jgi:hypothetical protein
VRSGVATVLDRVADVSEALGWLADHRTMVGVPAEKSPRQGGFGNASIAYVMENGDASGRVPARPHLKPGVQRVQAETEQDLRRALDLALAGDRAGAERQFHRIGLRAVNSIRAVIRGKIPPPLAPSTIAGRIRRMGKKKRRALRDRLAWQPSLAWSMFTPLIDTGAYIKSIAYVIRKRRA